MTSHITPTNHGQSTGFGMVGRNLAANIVGRVWTGIISIIFVPLYLAYMGPEAFGLVGLFSMMFALFGVLDLGLSATLNRELARYSANRWHDSDARDLVKTMQCVFWGIGTLIGAVVVGFAPLVSRYWVRADNLSARTIEHAVVLMGLVIAVQWPIGLYNGGLIGLQRQVLSSGLGAGLATFRSVGAILVLWLVSPSISAYFMWQGLSSLVGAVVTGAALWYSLPECDRAARVRFGLLKSVWRFAAGLSVNTALTLMLTQLDKVILSKILPLKDFGYYALATSVVGGLTLLSGSVFSAVFPNLSRSVAADDSQQVSETYHRSSQLMAVLIGPVAVVLSLFSLEIIQVWTDSATIGARTHVLVSFLAVSAAVNGLVCLPYALSLAYGWTSLSVYVNGISVVVLAPLTVLMTLRYGIIGAAIAPLILNTGYFIAFVQVLHSRYLRGEGRRWYLQDLGVPLGAAILIAMAGKWIGAAESGYRTLVWIGVIWAAAAAGAAMSARDIRGWIMVRVPCLSGS